MAKKRKGHSFSEESRKKMSLAKIGKIPWNKGKPWSEEVKKKISKSKKGKSYGPDFNLKNSIGHRGAKHYNYKGGSKNNRLCTSAWRALRKKILERDDFTCHVCKVKYTGKDTRKLCVHHIIAFEIIKNDDEKNLITTCQSCHSKEGFSMKGKKHEQSSN